MTVWMPLEPGIFLNIKFSITVDIDDHLSKPKYHPDISVGFNSLVEEWFERNNIQYVLRWQPLDSVPDNIDLNRVQIGFESYTIALKFKLCFGKNV